MQLDGAGCFAAVFAVVFSFAVAFGDALENETSVLSSRVVLNAAAIAVILIPICLALAKALAGALLNGRGGGGTSSCNWKAACVLIIVLPQLAWFLFLFPGIYGYDGGYHIWQVVHEPNDPIALNKGYSVPYTLFLGGFVLLGKSFGHASLGFAAAMFLQAAFLVFIELYAVFFIDRLANRLGLTFCTALFFGLNPFLNMMHISSSQDSFFTAFFVLTGIELVKLMLAIGDDSAVKRCACKMSVFALAMMLFRNNGLYLFLVLIVLSPFLVPKGFRAKAFTVLLVPVLLFSVINGPLYKLAGVQDVVDYGPSNTSPYPIREMLGIPSQQLGYVWTNEREGLSASQIMAFSSFYDVDSFGYSSEISDPAKIALDPTFTSEHLSDYLHLWIGVGIGHPVAYAKAFAMNSLGFWYPLKHYPDYGRMYHPLIESGSTYPPDFNASYVDISKGDVFGEFRQAFEGWSREGGFSAIPVVRLLFNPAIYLWVYVFITGILLISKRPSGYLLAALIAGLLVTCLLSPVCLYRYCMPYITAMPVLIASLVAVDQQKGKAMAVALV